MAAKSAGGVKKGDFDDATDPSFTIYSEWSESEIAAEKWASKHAYEDVEQTPLPRSLRKALDVSKRASDITTDAIVVVLPAVADDLFLATTACVAPALGGDIKFNKRVCDTLDEDTVSDGSVLQPPVVDDETPPGMSKFVLHNRHLLHSEFMLSVLSSLHFVYDMCRGRPEESLPWDNIYPKAKDGLPTYNPSGKYIVKLFWLGTWRKVVVDDRIPLDINGKALLVTSPSNELWPAILTKALLKLANMSVSVCLYFGLCQSRISPSSMNKIITKC